MVRRLFQRRGKSAGGKPNHAPYQVLLIRPTWLDISAQSPSANIIFISRTLLEIVDVSPSESYDICAELNDKGVAVLGCWEHHRCVEVEQRLKVKEISCRLVPAPQDAESGSAVSVDREEAVGAIPIKEWITRDKDLEKLEQMEKQKEEEESWRDNGSVISSVEGEDKAKEAFLSRLEDDNVGDNRGDAEWGEEGAVQERQNKRELRVDTATTANAAEVSADESRNTSPSTPVAELTIPHTTSGDSAKSANSLTNSVASASYANNEIQRAYDDGIISKLEFDQMLKADTEFTQTQVDLHNEAVANEVALQRASMRAKHKPKPLPPLLTADGRVPDIYDAYGNRHAEVQWVNSRIYNANAVTLDDMCLVEFCRKFCVPRKGPHAGRIKYHKGGYITKDLQFNPQYDHDKDGPDYGKYCRFALVRYRPWVDSPFGKDKDGNERKPDLDECKVDWEAHVFHLRLRRSKIPDMLLPLELKSDAAANGGSPTKLDDPTSPYDDEGNKIGVDAARVAAAMSAVKNKKTPGSVDYAPMDVKSMAIQQAIERNAEEGKSNGDVVSPKAGDVDAQAKLKAANEAAERAQTKVVSPEDARKRAMLLLGLADASSANISVKDELAKVAAADLNTEIEMEKNADNADDLSNVQSADTNDEEDEVVNIDTANAADEVATAEEIHGEKEDTKQTKKPKKRKTFKASFKRSLSKGTYIESTNDAEINDNENAVAVQNDDAKSDITAGEETEDRAGEIESKLSDLDYATTDIMKKSSEEATELISASDKKEKKADNDSDDDDSIAYFSEEDDDHHSIGSFSVHDIDGVPDDARKIIEEANSADVDNENNAHDTEPKAEIDFDDMLDDSLMVSAEAEKDEKYDPNKNQLDMFLEDADEDYYKQADNEEPSVASSQNRIKGKIGNALKRSGSVGSPRKSMRIPSVKAVSVSVPTISNVSVPKPPKPSKPSKLINRVTSKGSKGATKKPSKKYSQLGEGMEDDDDVSILSERTSAAGSITRSESHGALDMSAVDDESVSTRDSEVPIMHDPFATPETSSRDMFAQDSRQEKEPVVEDLFAKQPSSVEAPTKSEKEEPVEDLFANQQAASTFSEMRAADEAFAGGFPDVSTGAGATDAFGFITNDDKAKEDAADTSKDEEDPFVSFEPFGSAILDEEDAMNALDALAQFVPARAASFEAEGEKSDVANVAAC